MAFVNGPPLGVDEVNGNGEGTAPEWSAAERRWGRGKKNRDAMSVAQRKVWIQLGFGDLCVTLCMDNVDGSTNSMAGVVCFLSPYPSWAFGLRAVPSPIFDPSDLPMGDHSG